jgi:hypothetical protein
LSNRPHNNKKRWLYDDGGLTVLIPHLLRAGKSRWAGAELRILTLVGDRHHVELDEDSMQALLAKFRIRCSAVKVLDLGAEKLRPEM